MGIALHRYIELRQSFNSSFDRAFHATLKQLVMIKNYWMRFCDIRNNQGRGKCHQPRPFG